MRGSDIFGGHNFDRRQCPRKDGKIPRLAVCGDDGSAQDALVLDESLTGVSLLVKDGAPFQANQEVRLTHGERELLATVKHIQQREDGKFHLGLEWGPCEIKPASLLFLIAQ